MTSTFSLTDKQKEAQKVLSGKATHICLFGGSRSGKTFLLIRNTVARAIKAKGSRHGVFRFRLNAARTTLFGQTLPKVMKTCFPGLEHESNKSEAVVTLPNKSTIIFGGLDDKERCEKVLGDEYATLYLNECSQIPYESRNMVLTRLAQRVEQNIPGVPDKLLKTRFYYDMNPPPKSHWTYKLFILRVDPETGITLPDPSNYESFKMNPADNAHNLDADYLNSLQNMSARNRRRFWDGEFADSNPNGLFDINDIDKWRVTHESPPQMVRVVVAVDPSGSGDVDNADNDAIGIVVAGLGVDGNCYVMDDCTVKAGPATWGRIATSAFDRHGADVIVGEINYGGAMVNSVIQASRPRTNFKQVTASRGKSVRAEPFSALYEQGKIRHIGYFRELEDELEGFSTYGYVGDKSPNRADALIWALTELFPGVLRTNQNELPVFNPKMIRNSTGWMNR